MSRKLTALVLIAWVCSVAVLLANYAFVNSEQNVSGVVDPGDVTLTGVTAGNTVVSCAGLTSAAAAPSVSGGGTWETPVTGLWLNNLRRLSISYILNATGGDTTVTWDVAGGDTAVYDFIYIAEYSGVDGSLSDSEFVASADGDDTNVITSTLDVPAGGALMVGCSHTQSGQTGTGMTNREAGASALSGSMDDKRGTSNQTMEWTWTGNGWGGAAVLVIEESAGGGGGGGANPAQINSPIRGGGVLDPLVRLGVTPMPTGPRLVQSAVWRRGVGVSYWHR